MKKKVVVEKAENSHDLIFFASQSHKIRVKNPHRTFSMSNPAMFVID